LLTAFGYDWVPGNLAGALALMEAGEEATRIQIGYFGQGSAGRSGGTQASLISALLEPSFAFRGGRLRTERLGALAPARAALETVLGRQAKGSTGGPDEAARSRSSSTVLATAYTADGRELNTVRLDGVNSYTFGFEMLAWAASAAVAGNVNAPGALGPVAAFGPNELEAGVRAAGIDRVR
jgi:hypothetical protein